MAATRDFPGMHPSVAPSWIPPSLAQESCAEEVSTGTTLVAVEFADGVVLGADSRTSMGTYVANRVTDKLTPISSNIMACRSGSAADTQAVTDIVRYKIDFLEIERGDKVPVQTAAYLFKEMCYDYRDQLMAGIIVAGWDKEKGGQVYSVPLGGMMVRQPATIGGSGSTFLYGKLDAQYNPKMKKEECCKMVLDLVTHAINRDGSSGGCCRIAIITKDGIERRTHLHNELPKFENFMH